MPNTISAIIITKNEGLDIAKCLNSISWVDEIIVVDSGSTDDTCRICEQAGAKVIITDWPGFGPQKNRALEAATKDWVLSIDADEVVPEDLKTEILKKINNSDNIVAYHIPRRSFFCGKEIKHFALWLNDKPIRLVKRGCGAFTPVSVHEELIIDGEIGNMSSHLLHYSYKDLNEVITKLNSYSSLEAINCFNNGKRVTFLKAIYNKIATFIKSYFFKKAFLDGKEGFILAVAKSQETYYRYLKILELQKNAANK